MTERFESIVCPVCGEKDVWCSCVRQVRSFHWRTRDAAAKAPVLLACVCSRVPCACIPEEELG